MAGQAFSDRRRVKRALEEIQETPDQLLREKLCLNLRELLSAKVSEVPASLFVYHGGSLFVRAAFESLGLAQTASELITIMSPSIVSLNIANGASTLLNLPKTKLQIQLGNYLYKNPQVLKALVCDYFPTFSELLFGIFSEDFLYHVDCYSQIPDEQTAKNKAQLKVKRSKFSFGHSPWQKWRNGLIDATILIGSSGLASESGVSALVNLAHSHQRQRIANALVINELGTSTFSENMARSATNQAKFTVQWLVSFFIELASPNLPIIGSWIEKMPETALQENAKAIFSNVLRTGLGLWPYAPISSWLERKLVDKPTLLKNWPWPSYTLPGLDLKVLSRAPKAHSKNS